MRRSAHFDVARRLLIRRLSLSPAVGRVATFNLTLSLAWQLSVPIVPLLAVEAGATTILVGLTVGASSMLPLLLGLPTGWVSDRMPTRRLQMLAAVSMVAAFTIMLLADNLAALFVGQALIGLSNMVSSVAAHTFIATATTGIERDDTYGRYSFLVAISNVAGPAIGGLYGGWAGPRSVLVIALVVAVASLPQVLWLPGSSVGPTRAPASLDTRPGLSVLDVLRPWIVRFSLIGGFLIIFGNSVKASFYVLYLDSVDFSSDTIGLLLSTGGAATIAIRPVLAWATMRLGYARLLTLLCATMGLGLGAVPLLGAGLIGQVAAALVTGAAYGLSQPLTIAMIANAASQERLGLAFTWRQMAQRGGELASPLLLGLVATFLDLEAVFWFAGGLLFLAAVCTRPRRRL
jgi:MFS family permease